jgi:hypothetical protein
MTMLHVKYNIWGTLCKTSQNIATPVFNRSHRCLGNEKQMTYWTGMKLVLGQSAKRAELSENNPPLRKKIRPGAARPLRGLACSPCGLAMARPLRGLAVSTSVTITPKTHSWPKAMSEQYISVIFSVLLIVCLFSLIVLGLTGKRKSAELPQSNKLQFGQKPSDVERPSESSGPPAEKDKREGRDRGFAWKWKQDPLFLNWLDYNPHFVEKRDGQDVDLGPLMFCTACRDCGLKNNMCKGTAAFNKATLLEHIAKPEHIQALKSRGKLLLQQQAIRKGCFAETDKARTMATNHMRDVYHISLHGGPMTM